jgi:hypothetical protein
MQYSKETDIHAPGGIRNQNPRKQVAAHHTLNRADTVISICLTFSRLMTYICRTAPLTPRRCTLYIYSTNIRTEYFKHATFFGSCIIHILNTGVLKFKRKFRRLKVNTDV